MEGGRNMEGARSGVGGRDCFSQRRNFIKIVEPVKGSEQRKVKLRFVS